MAPRPLLAAALLCSALYASATFAEETSKPEIQVYGFAMTDTGFNAGTIDPDWYDVLRPTKLPKFDGEFGDEGRWFFGVRQSRLGLKAKAPTHLGDLKVHLEGELFGVGDDAGRTTFRLRHAFGELGQFGAGQTWSSFMDIDVFPNSVEYWGPSGMVFYRNVQVRWRGDFGPSQVQVSLENPGGSADTDNYADRVELENVTARFPVPDVAAYYKLGGKWGYVKVAGIARYLAWDDVGTGPTNLTGHAWGWGGTVSSNINFSIAVLRLQAVYGAAIQNYMNDAALDVAVETRADPARPLVGVALKSLGTSAFVDLNWSKYFTSTIGHSFIRIYNSNGQGDDAFKLGHYALANLLIHPTEDFMFGPEFQWGQRQNFRDGWSYDTWRIQVSLKYSFSQTFSKQ
jgi:hypothetical protein